VKRILVGVDGSDAAAAALGWAGRLAHVVGAEVVVATVFEPDQAEVSPDRYEELTRSAERLLDTEWSAPLSGSGAPRRSLLLTGPPDALLEAAEHQDVDLVVVGPRGHSRFARLHIGSLAHHLAHYTTRPLAIVPAPGAAAAFDRIVVGVDGSEGSAHAVRWCTDMARATHAEIIAVYAFEPLVEWVLESDPRSWRQAAERRLEDNWVAPLRQAGVAVRTRIIDDIHPVAALAGRRAGGTRRRRRGRHTGQWRVPGAPARPRSHAPGPPHPGAGGLGAVPGCRPKVVRGWRERVVTNLRPAVQRAAAELVARNLDRSYLRTGELARLPAGDTYRSGLEAHDGDLGGIHSVASFFISVASFFIGRVDTTVDAACYDALLGQGGQAA